MMNGDETKACLAITMIRLSETVRVHIFVTKIDAVGITVNLINVMYVVIKKYLIMN